MQLNIDATPKAASSQGLHVHGLVRKSDYQTAVIALLNITGGE